MKGPNTVKLIGYYGGDITHAGAAWVLDPTELPEDRLNRVATLLKEQLMGMGKDGHGPPHTSPFEKSLVHFQVRTDIATHIHLIKHRTLSINGESARYKELKEDKFYTPDDWPEELQERLVNHVHEGQTLYHETLRYLIRDHGFDRKRAKETARYFLPYASQIDADVSGNFHAFAHFLRLRNEPHAQAEVRWLASEMRRLVAETGAFDASLEAWGV